MVAIPDELSFCFFNGDSMVSDLRVLLMFRALLVRAVPLLRGLNALILENPPEPELVCSGEGGISTNTCSLRFKLSESDVLRVSERGVNTIALIMLAVAVEVVVVGEKELWTRSGVFSRAQRDKTRAGP